MHISLPLTAQYAHALINQRLVVVLCMIQLRPLMYEIEFLELLESVYHEVAAYYQLVQSNGDIF